VGSSAVVLWSLTPPLGALVFAGRRPAAGWLAAYVLLILIGAAAGYGYDNDLPNSLVTIFFVMNLGGVSIVVFVLLHYFVGEKDLALTILDRERRWIRDAFSSYISPNLVRQLIEHPDELALGGERRECSFVLTDLAGFTTLVEQAEPELVVALLNEYLDGMTRIALAQEGTLDRIVGDAMAVMFSAPVAQPDHAQRAVRCALEMDRFATGFSARVACEDVPLRGTRIGVSSGTVIVGHVGSRDRLDYRALGDPINTAKRLEDANRYFGTRVCVAAATVARVPGFVGRRLGLLQLAGSGIPSMPGKQSRRTPPSSGRSLRTRRRTSRWPPNNRVRSIRCGSSNANGQPTRWCGSIGNDSKRASVERSSTSYGRPDRSSAQMQAARQAATPVAKPRSRFRSDDPARPPRRAGWRGRPPSAAKGARSAFCPPRG